MKLSLIVVFALLAVASATNCPGDDCKKDAKTKLVRFEKIRNALNLHFFDGIFILCLYWFNWFWRFQTWNC